MISTEGRASFDFCLLPHRAQLAATRPSDTAREQGRGGERVGWVSLLGASRGVSLVSQHDGQSLPRHLHSSPSTSPVTASYLAEDKRALE